MLTYEPNSYEEIIKVLWMEKYDNLNCHHNQIIIETPSRKRTNLVEHIEKAISDDVRSIVVRESSIIAHDNRLFIHVTVGNNVSKIDIWHNNYGGKHSHYEEFVDKISKNYHILEGYVKWIYDSYNSDIIVSLDNDTEPLEEMYPFLNGKTVNEYYDSFLDSRSSILLLIGPPGTGKTTFIKGLIQYSKEIARVCYDDALLSKDGIFSDFIDSSDTFFILEDADSFLTSRKEGNTMMHKFLNVGDGLVKTRHKKMIFSTNIPSLKDVDSALIRPGRCFDILKFDLLNSDESRVLANKIGSSLVIEDGKSYSAAEIFNSQNNSTTVNRPVGFI